MLVLSRKKGQSIQIGSDISVTVIEVRGDKVRLGVEADRETPVHRQEVADAIAKAMSNQEASEISPLK
jgi:carbon storage regulator